jgi:hypothetical protein
LGKVTSQRNQPSSSCFLSCYLLFEFFQFWRDGPSCLFCVHIAVISLAIVRPVFLPRTLGEQELGTHDCQFVITLWRLAYLCRGLKFIRFLPAALFCYCIVEICSAIGCFVLSPYRFLYIRFTVDSERDV